jgi:REP element-mobilizing transposase RayT
MADYRRWFLPGGTYFFTIVTEGRVPLFVNNRARRLRGSHSLGNRRLTPRQNAAI